MEIDIARGNRKVRVRSTGTKGDIRFNIGVHVAVEADREIRPSPAQLRHRFSCDSIDQDPLCKRIGGGESMGSRRLVFNLRADKVINIVLDRIVNQPGHIRAPVIVKHRGIGTSGAVVVGHDPHPVADIGIPILA